MDAALRAAFLFATAIAVPFDINVLPHRSALGSEKRRGL
jgi:hypothetical protein